MMVHGPNSIPPPPLVAPERPRSKLAWLGWLLLLVVALAAGIFYAFRHRPLEQAQSALRQMHDQRKAENQKLAAERAELRVAHGALQRQNEELDRKLKQALAEKAAAIAELERARGELVADLETEIAAGDVKIEKREERLVVGVADEILFASGEAVVSKKGEAVLRQIAGTLSRLKSNVIQVGGHTDDAPIVSPEVRERFPTNWELSAARATNVVRFLQTTGIPGGRLMAAGFAQYRPAASGRGEAARRQNRRIEIVLLRSP
jgi:chemotaxis protein MotB